MSSMHATGTPSITTRSSRSAGERAFDRCFFPLPLYLVHLLALGFAYVVPSSADPDMTGVPPLYVWVLFSLGLLLGIHWVWALRSVIAAWIPVGDRNTRDLEFIYFFN